MTQNVWLFWMGFVLGFSSAILLALMMGAREKK